MLRNLDGVEPFEEKLWLATPTMHGEELAYITEAYVSNWMSTVGANIDEAERMVCEKVGCKHAVALSCGTAALHLALRLVGLDDGDEVACSDMTFCATVNPIVYEGATPVFVDSERETWNMDPKALDEALLYHPNVKAVVVAHLYGTPANMGEIRRIARYHDAAVIEDAAESLGATYGGRQTGTLGHVGCISFNGNKIITGSSGGMLLSDSDRDAGKVRKWSTQAREAAPWYQHETYGYNYRMSNVIAGVVRGQLPYLEEHVACKKEIYERYHDAFAEAGLPVSMNPYDPDACEPNFWLSCLLIEPDAMCRQVRGERDVLYAPEAGKSCPHEILDALASINAEGRPIWKPMHLQPVYRNFPFFTREGNGRCLTNAYAGGEPVGEDGLLLDVGADIFQRGLCLPSDIKMTPEQQDKVIEVVKRCFA